MNAKSTANAYKTQQIMTAAPEELTLMLYNGALRFISESIQGLERRELKNSHKANMRAQEIGAEFMTTLDMQQEISQNWFLLYEYIHYRLINGNMKKDKAPLEEARERLQDLRDTWVELIKQTRMSKVATK